MTGMWAWARRHLAVDTVAGRRLPGGFAVLVGLGMVGAVLAEAAADDIPEGDGVAAADRPLLRLLAGHRDGPLNAVMRLVTTIGSPLGVTLAVLVSAGLVWWRVRRVWPWLLTGVVLGGAELLETITKTVVARPRPPLALRVPGISADGYSFPSGHATLAAAGYGLVAVLLVRVVRGMLVRVAVWAGAAAAAVLVGVSRLYLGAHWFSDVAAGWATGAAWLAVVLTASWLLARHARAVHRPRGQDGAPA
jgi:membrane-associated phospholipid phosphatase